MKLMRGCVRRSETIPTNIKIQPVWVGKKLKATRSNVLNPAEIDAFTPGAHIFPEAPLWKKSDVKENTEAINKLLAPYNKNDEYYEVDIEFLSEILSYMPSKQVSAGKWEDNRIKQALKTLKAKGIQNGRLMFGEVKTAKVLT
jgi:hypothetical protein